MNSRIPGCENSIPDPDRAVQAALGECELLEAINSARIPRAEPSISHSRYMNNIFWMNELDYKLFKVRDHIFCIFISLASAGDIRSI